MDSDGLLSGLVGFGGGLIKGMNDAEDRKYKRMEFEAKMKAAETERQKTEDSKTLELFTKGYNVPPKGQPYDISTLKFRPDYIETQTGLRTASQLGDPYGSKALAAELAKQNLSKGTAEAEERAKKKTPQGKVEGLSGDQRGQFDKTTGAYDALLDIKGAYAKIAEKTKGKSGGELIKGKSEMVGLPLRGDTEYTTAKNQFVEFLGRLQSGGAIGKNEVDIWTSLIPGPLDPPEIAEKKLADLEFRMGAKLKGFGLSPEDARGAGFLKPRSGAGPQAKPKRVEQGGKIFILNEQTGEYE